MVSSGTTLPAEPQFQAPGMLVNGVKLVGETVLPGASLLVDGKVLSGLAHAAVGLGARAAFGPIGFLAVAAESYSQSVTSKHLWDLVTDAARSLAPGQAPQAPVTTPPGKAPAPDHVPAPDH